jgi:hypothetical protein
MFCRDCCAATLSFLFYCTQLLLVPYLLLYHPASNIEFSRRSNHQIAAAISAVTSTVHHSCSRPASAIKAKQRKQASTDRLQHQRVVE